MVHVSRTVNPLHFEDLEPHRFEDLVRQLIYDFKDWQSIEATGRAGSDDGFDIRAWENVNAEEGSEEDDEGERAVANLKNRIWLIQCKREKKITPKKIETYVQDIKVNSELPIYGAIFAASCDFSNKARDVFRNTIREKGIQEFYLWGKAELEDMLFQPNNDNLLFAYFGISLQIRKRSLRTKLCSRIATKKKVLRVFANNFHKQVLLRDANDTKYPYLNEIPDFHENPAWKVYEFKEQDTDGIKLLVGKFMAYLADDEQHFDFVDGINEARPWNDPWPKKKTLGTMDGNEIAIRKFWQELPEKNRAHFEILGVVEYDNILAVDEDGDNIFNGPHIYIPFRPHCGPFAGYYRIITTYGQYYKERYIKNENRIEYFTEKFPKLKKIEKKN
ncbi:MAG: restriction endonuclease [Phycisphaerae bacterium]|jgi:hypothetical protein